MITSKIKTTHTKALYEHQLLQDTAGKLLFFFFNLRSLWLHNIKTRKCAHSLLPHVFLWSHRPFSQHNIVSIKY